MIRSLLFIRRYHRNQRNHKEVRNLRSHRNLRRNRSRRRQVMIIGLRQLLRLQDPFTWVAMRKMNGRRSWNLTPNYSRKNKKWRNSESRNRRKRWGKTFRDRFRRKIVWERRIWRKKLPTKNLRSNRWPDMMKGKPLSSRTWRISWCKRSFQETSNSRMRTWGRSKRWKRREILIKEWSNRLKGSFRMRKSRTSRESRRKELVWEQCWRKMSATKSNRG